MEGQDPAADIVADEDTVDLRPLVVAPPDVSGAVVVSGPDDFLSFELRLESGEVLWRVEASRPTAVAAFTYGVVPPGFRQTLPASGEPSGLSAGDAVILEHKSTFGQLGWFRRADAWGQRGAGRDRAIVAFGHLFRPVE